MTFIAKELVLLNNQFDVVITTILIVIVVVVTSYYWKRYCVKYSTTKTKKVDEERPKSSSKASSRKGVVCPFSAGSDFIIETAEHLPLTPLEVYEDWSEDYIKQLNGDDSVSNVLKPLAARWLNMGMSGQDTPGILRAGLRRLRNAKYFLVEEPHRLEIELRMKMKAFDDPNRHPLVFVAEEDSIPAQQEVVDLFLEYLPRRYPDQYVYNKELNTIHVNCIDTTFRINDWYHTRPLELCERIVQEDLVLMRPPTADDVVKGETSYHMAAAAVVFSFVALPEKLGKPVEFLHAPVPGYEQHIRKSMNFTFSKLKVEQPMWRNNWGISPSGDLDKPLYGSALAQEERYMSTSAVSVETVKSRFLKVEYQTIRRLPKSSYLLFTINTMVEPMYELETVPMAASCLAASIRGMSSAMRKYKGIDSEGIYVEVLKYLDSIGCHDDGGAATK
jgi:dimethylamine monooxygenase subunit A